MKHENQLEFVRQKLGSTPRDEWMQVAANAHLNLRTLYNVVDPSRNPGYSTVYKLYVALKEWIAKGKRK
jgi:hypothetical protein